jgi:hypothetical protein
MAVGIELARAMEPLTFFQIEAFNALLAIRCKSATQLNTQPYCEKTRYSFRNKKSISKIRCTSYLFFGRERRHHTLRDTKIITCPSPKPRKNVFLRRGCATRERVGKRAVNSWPWHRLAASRRGS